MPCSWVRASSRATKRRPRPRKRGELGARCAAYRLDCLARVPNTCLAVPNLRFSSCGGGMASVSVVRHCPGPRGVPARARLGVRLQFTFRLSCVCAQMGACQAQQRVSLHSSVAEASRWSPRCAQDPLSLSTMRFVCAYLASASHSDGVHDCHALLIAPSRLALMRLLGMSVVCHMGASRQALCFNSASIIALRQPFA